MGFDYKEKLNATSLHCENLNLGSKVYKKKKKTIVILHNSFIKYRQQYFILMLFAIFYNNY